MALKIKIGDFKTEIDPKILEDGGGEIGVDINFGGSQMIKIQMDAHNNWHVVNAMDGWGNNNREEFINEKVIIEENNPTQR